MQIGNTPAAYGAVTKTLHWTMALLVVFMLCLGFYMDGMPLGAGKLQAYGLHKSVGTAVLMLAALRILWHGHSRRPPLLETLAWWEKLGAQAVHYFLYACMVGMPLSGWIFSSAAGRPVSFFGLFTLPMIAEQDESTVRLFKAIHFYLAWGLIAAVAAHVLAAFKHHFWNKDGTLRRMLPLAAALALLPVTAQAQDAAVRQWDVVAADSAITFSGRQMGEGFKGAFKNMTADIAFDPARLDKSRVAVDVDIASADSGNAERDTALKGAEWFDIKLFPAARFESSSFKKTGENAYEAAGTLTIRGISVPDGLPFILQITKNETGTEKAVMRGDVTLDRSKFQLGQGDWEDPTLIANDVAVHITVTALAQASATTP